MRLKGIVLLIVPLMFGCAVRDEVRRVRAQLNYIEGSTRRIESKVDQLDSLSREEIELIIRFRAEQLAATSRVEREVESTKAVVNELLGISTTETGDPTLSDLYSIAHSDYLRGNYDLAISGLLAYIMSIPNLDEARYLLGKSYLETGEHEKAIRAFNRVVEDYPRSSRAPASLYKIGKLWEAKGDTLLRNQYFERLLKDYPGSPEAALLGER